MNTADRAALQPRYPCDGDGDEDAYNRGWNDCLAALDAQPLGEPDGEVVYAVPTDDEKFEHYTRDKLPALCDYEVLYRSPPATPQGWVMVPVEPTGDDLWIDAMNAFYAAVPPFQHGFSEWCAKMQAAIKVLSQLPAAETEEGE